MTEIMIDEWSNIFTPSDFIAFLVIFLLSFFGSVGKDYLRMFAMQKHMSLSRILLSTITSTVFIFALCDTIIEYSGVKGLMCVSFISGLLGFELLQRVSTIGGLIKFIGNILETYSTIRETITQNKKVEQSEKEKDDTAPQKEENVS